MLDLLRTPLHAATLGQFFAGWIAVIAAYSLLDGLARAGLTALFRREALSTPLEAFRLTSYDLVQLSSSAVVIAVIAVALFAQRKPRPQPTRATIARTE